MAHLSVKPKTLYSCVDGGNGGASAATVAKKLMEAYFKYYPPFESLEKAGSVVEGEEVKEAPAQN